ncbi:hypothetical protein [Comamonas composti]|uniref:hypothetical protein n=1 Tax=Comamonas composti TaxID=408558 RepID=UPI00040C296B|nr:hypothetical protein [Comamonas composti]
MTQAQTLRYRWAVLCRVLLAVLGGYGLTALACAVLAHGLVAVGAMERAPAVLLATLLSFVLYTVVALWVFHVPRVQRVAAVLAAWALVLAAALLALKGGL